MLFIDYWVVMVRNAGKILLFVTHGLRDLRGLIQLKILLESYGAAVRIVSFGRDASLNFFTYFPDLIVVPSIEEEFTQELTRICHEVGSKVVELKSEGVVTSEEVGRLLGAAYAGNNHVDLHLVWGAGMKDILLNYSSNPINIKVCGNPRFDVYRSPLNKMIPSRKKLLGELGIPPNAKVVLYATNFNYADMEPVPASFPEVPPSEFHKVKFVFKLNRDMRKKSMSYIKRLARKNPETYFVLKRHPFENPQSYRKIIHEMGLPNVLLVEREMELYEILPHIDALIHWNSTASIEAWLCDKPTLHLEIIKSPVYSEIVAGSNIIHNFDELADDLTYYLAGGKIPKRLLSERSRILKKWFFKVDGESTNRCAKEIMKIMPKGRSHKRPWFNLHVLMLAAKGFPRKASLTLPPTLTQALFSLMKRIDRKESIRSWGNWSIISRKRYTAAYAKNLEKEIRKAYNV